MSGNRSRNKGQRGERQVIEMLQPVVNEVYSVHGREAPVLKRNTLQSDGGGSDIAGLPWLALEVKYQEQLSLNTWWAQCLEQAGTVRDPVLFYRRNKVAWGIMMYGMLGMPGARFTTRVIVTPEDFLLWFRIRLSQELEK